MAVEAVDEGVLIGDSTVVDQDWYLCKEYQTGIVRGLGRSSQRRVERRRW